MNTITLKLPAQFAMSPLEFKLFLAAKLYEADKITAGQGAELVGISKRAFLEVLGQYGVSTFGYDFEELQEDLKHV